MSNPKRVGEGSYGCVHNPPLKCKDKPYNPDLNKVSKILTKEHANDELKEFKLIKKADKKEDFHLGKPMSCLPDKNINNKMAIDECKKFDSNKINEYKLLLLKNGGKDLKQIKDKYKLLQENNQNRRKLENFWLDMSRILYGSKVLIENNIMHHDLKQENIVYNEETGRVNFIDFGFMTTIEKMKKKAEKSDYPYDAHWSFPAEIVLYDRSVYNRLCNLTGKKKDDKIILLYKKYKMIENNTIQRYTYDSTDE